jgi:hypothetical protein
MVQLVPFTPHVAVGKVSPLHTEIYYLILKRFLKAPACKERPVPPGARVSVRLANIAYACAALKIRREPVHASRNGKPALRDEPYLVTVAKFQSLDPFDNPFFVADV